MQENELKILIGADGKPLTKTLGELEQELKDFQKALKTTTDPVAIDQLNRSLDGTKKNISALKNFTLGPNEGNLRRSLSTVNSFNQLLREMPAFTFSAQTGILALSNNIPIFMDRITEARAGGAKFGTIFKDIGKSLLSFPSLLTIGVSALTIFGDKIFSTGKKATQAQDEFEAFLKSVRSAGQIRGEAAGSVSGQIAEVQALTRAVLDQTRSETERGRALDRLKQINKQYYGDFTLATATTKNLTSATQDYTKAIVQQAVVKAFSEEITKLTLELYKQNKVLGQLQAEHSALGQVSKENIRAATQYGAAWRDVSAIIRKGDAEERFLKQRDAVDKIRGSIADLTSEIEKATDIGLKLKPLDTPAAGPKAESLKFTLQDLFKIVRNKQDEEFLKLREASEKGAADYYDGLIKAMQRGNAEVNSKLKAVLAGGPAGQFQQQIQERPAVGGTTPTTQLEENYQLMLKIRALGAEPVPTGYLSDVGARNLLLKEQLATLTKLNEIQREQASIVANALTPAFQSFFDTLLAGSEDPFKALENAFKNLLKQLVTTIATAATLALILNAIFPGSGGFTGIFKSLLGVGNAFNKGGNNTGMANPSFNSSNLGMAPLQVSGELRGRGRDLVLVINNELQSQGRTI